MSALEAHIERCRRCHDALIDLEIEEALPHDDAGTQVEPAPAAPERIIGPYRLISELGRGGQACVYLAEDTRLPRRVALKVFQSGLAASPSVLLRFQREAASLSRFDHPGICTVYETGEWRGISYIAMRLVDGETLARWITRRVKAKAGGEVPDRAALLEAGGLIERSARALHVAHEAGIVHRDIKPSNIMIAEGGEPVIVDFGLARDEESADPTLTRPGDVAGTPVYMSPEQIRGRRALVDRRSDVFSLGVMAYEALTLTLPFEAPTTPAVFQKILSGPIRTLRAPVRSSEGPPRHPRDRPRARRCASLPDRVGLRRGPAAISQPRDDPREARRTGAESVAGRSETRS
jgi:serine/threonine protein kinase